VAEFLQILTSFPTVVFAAALAVAMVFWSISLLGALDADVLEGSDVDVDVDLDLDADVDADAEGTFAEGAWLGLAQLVRLGRVPLTVTLTLLALGGFVSSFLLAWGGLQLRGQPLGPVGAFGVLLLALVLAVGFANLGSRPLEPVFRVVLARSNRALVGEVCTISTGRVDRDFGQADVVVELDHLTVQVRCDTEGAALSRGSKALIVSFDSEREAFVVEPLADPSTTTTGGS